MYNFNDLKKQIKNVESLNIPIREKLQLIKELKKEMMSIYCKTKYFDYKEWESVFNVALEVEEMFINELGVNYLNQGD